MKINKLNTQQKYSNNNNKTNISQ